MDTVSSKPLLLSSAVYKGLHRLGYNSAKPEQFDSVESLLKGEDTHKESEHRLVRIAISASNCSELTVQLGRAAPRDNFQCKRYLGLLLGIVPLQRVQIVLIGLAILSLSWQATGVTYRVQSVLLPNEL